MDDDDEKEKAETMEVDSAALNSSSGKGGTNRTAAGEDGDELPGGYANDDELERALREYGKASREGAEGGEAEEGEVQATLQKLKEMRARNLAEGRQMDVEPRLLGKDEPIPGEEEADDAL